VEITAISRDNVRVLSKGTLLLVDNIVDQKSATMRLKAVFAKEDEQRWPGDFVNAHVLLGCATTFSPFRRPLSSAGPTAYSPG
jgi:hypothetical protein